MPQTIYQQIEKPKDREALLEQYLQQRLEEVGAVFGNAYLEGLTLEWVSASSIKVKAGAADFANGSRRLRVTADITVTGIALGNNAWGHVYLYNNAGVAAVEVVTTAPVNYFGSAWQKTGDATRRYLGSVRTNSSGSILQFYQHADEVHYLANIDAAPLLVLSLGTATTETSVSCAAVVPVTSRLALFRISNTATSGSAYMGAGTGAGDDSVTPPTNGLTTVLAGGTAIPWLVLNASQAISYAYSAAPGGGGALFVNLLGYRFQR